MKLLGRKVILPIAFLAYSQSCFSNPTGYSVAAGDIAVTLDPNNPHKTIITQGATTPKAIINWQNFDIAPHETTQFVQPSSNAIVLNRIHSNNPTEIFGQLNANGQIVLINPNGIHFRNGFSVNTAGLFCFTAHITDKDFLSGNHLFKQGPNTNGNIIAEKGTIKIKDSGVMALVAPTVKVNGTTIEGNLSTIEMGSSQVFTVDFFGDNLIHFATHVPVENAAETVADNQNGPEDKNIIDIKGEIKGNAAKVHIKVDEAKRIVENVINMEGIIKADSAFVDKNGEIVLTSRKSGVININGKLSNQGLNNNQGGNILIEGEKIRLSENAEIDVSGVAGGGKVFIGGDYRGGKDPKTSLHDKPIVNAKSVLITKDACIRANALEIGDGGKVIIWSDNNTYFDGKIAIKAGGLGGNGGFVETSGKEWFGIGSNAYIDAAGENGGGPGTWLLDPRNVNITFGLTTHPVFFPAGTFNPNNSPPTASPSTVNNFQIANFLNLGTHVTINTNTSSLAQAGNININALIIHFGGMPVTFTLNATGGIFANSIINSFNNNLNVSFNATNGTARVSRNIVIGNGSFNSQSQVFQLVPSGTITPHITAGAMTITAFQSASSIGSGGILADSLTLNVPANGTAHLTGNINGILDGSNIQYDEGFKCFGPGTHFFNGYDLYQYLPPCPPTPPNPEPTPTSTPTPTPTPPPNPTNPPPVSNPPPTVPPTNPPEVITTPTTPTTPPSGPTPPSTTPPSSTPPNNTPPSATPPTTTPPGETPTTSTPTTPTTPTTTTEPVTPTDSSTVPTNGIGGADETQEVAQPSKVGEEVKAPNAEESSAVSELRGEPVDEPCSEKKDKNPEGPSCVEGVKSVEAPPDTTLTRSNAISPTGMAGTDVPMGAAGIGGTHGDQEMNNSSAAQEEAAMKSLLDYGIVGTTPVVKNITDIASGLRSEILPAEIQLMRELEADRQNLPHRSQLLAPIP